VIMGDEGWVHGVREPGMKSCGSSMNRLVVILGGWVRQVGSRDPRGTNPGYIPRIAHDEQYKGRENVWLDARCYPLQSESEGRKGEEGIEGLSHDKRPQMKGCISSWRERDNTFV
jgi:hypothetical protein